MECSALPGGFHGVVVLFCVFLPHIVKLKENIKWINTDRFLNDEPSHGLERDYYLYIAT